LRTSRCTTRPRVTSGFRARLIGRLSLYSPAARRCSSLGCAHPSAVHVGREVRSLRRVRDGLGKVARSIGYGAPSARVAFSDMVVPWSEASPGRTWTGRAHERDGGRLNELARPLESASRTSARHSGRTPFDRATSRAGRSPLPFSCERQHDALSSSHPGEGNEGRASWPKPGTATNGDQARPSVILCVPLVRGVPPWLRLHGG
jgi:hypothetical protein